MSGVIANNPYRASGVIAAAAAGGLSWQDIVTASTLTAEAGNAYWIDTTSNACTITLPSSADNGDEIIFADYDRTWGTNAVTLDSNGLNYQGQDDSYDVEYGTDGQDVHIVYSGATNGWIPTLDKTVADVPSAPPNDNGIFGFGTGPVLGTTMLVSNVGVVGADVTAVGTARYGLGACEYGGDKAIFAFGGGPATNISNLVSNAGVVASDVTGVGTARYWMAACDYGGDKGIMAFGTTGSLSDISNLVSNVGVVATDVTSAGTAKRQPAGCEYGGDKGIISYGLAAGSSLLNTSTLVSNVGVIAANANAVGTARQYVMGLSYGEDKGIFAYGADSPAYMNVSNLVSNAGVVASDVTGVGTARSTGAGCEYGQDKGVFAMGNMTAPGTTPNTGSGNSQQITNLVSNTGVVATDGTAAVGQGRYGLGGCSYN